MSLIHSTENLPNVIDNYNPKQCIICDKDFELDEVIVSTPCKHIFHKNCIIRILGETPECPVCAKLCRTNRLVPYDIISNSFRQQNITKPPSNINTSLCAVPKVTNQPEKSNTNTLVDTNLPQTPIHNHRTQYEEARSLDPLVNLPQENSNAAFIRQESNRLNRNNTHTIPKSTNPKRKHPRRNLLENNLSQTHDLNENFNHRRSNQSLHNFQNNRNSINTQQYLENQNDSYLQNLIHETVRNHLSNLNLNHNYNPRLSSGGNNFNPNMVNQRQTRPYQNSDLTTEKVSNIISSWRIKFTGEEETGLSVDNFIYRVQALTNSELTC